MARAQTGPRTARYRPTAASLSRPTHHAPILPPPHPSQPPLLTCHPAYPPSLAVSQLSKQFNLYLGVSFFSMTLKFVDGVPPPPRERGVPKSHEYDVVTRKYVNRATSDTWTVARASAHFTDA